MVHGRDSAELAIIKQFTPIDTCDQKQIEQFKLFRKAAIWKLSAAATKSCSKTSNFHLSSLRMKFLAYGSAWPQSDHLRYQYYARKNKNCDNAETVIKFQNILKHLKTYFRKRKLNSSEISEFYENFYLIFDFNSLTTN